ncbi:MAG: formate/nitrite transporter family protein [Eubacteriales bacterium]|nr:formate/nitrite transporter family protein [Eubacteriales bacterium]
MLTKDVEAMAQAAVNKVNLCDEHFVKYFMRAVMAGFFIVVATILSNVSAAVLYPTYPQFGKLLGAFLFSIAIVLIVFIGGELFTGNNMTMAMGAYNGNCLIKDVIKVWVVSYIGNFIGAFILGAVFVGSGASHGIMVDYYNSFIDAKLSIAPMEMVLRGIMCNFMVCIAVLTGTRMKSESGKLIVMFCVIMAFVVAGFEHCIANMGTFSIAYMLLGGINLGLVAKSMFFVTIGNIIGGAVLLALPLKIMSAEN